MLTTKLVGSHIRHSIYHVEARQNAITQMLCLFVVLKAQQHPDGESGRLVVVFDIDD